MIQSPLNYTGGKFKLLSQILPLFPKNIRRFYDFFCGGCNVGINVDSKEVICLDKNKHLIYLYQTFQNVEKSEIFNWIYDIISKYGLSLVSSHGYEYYDCEGSTGLGKYNRDSFQRLRKDFNETNIFDYKYYIMMYVLIVYAFNNQIRFNGKGEFNLPVGKRDFNVKMQSKLDSFINRVQMQNYKFVCQDFRQFDLLSLKENDFVYADPPYLITCAAYNENGGWNKSDENDLLRFLDKLNERNIRFALSNVLISKGKKNQILDDWLSQNIGKYNAIHLQYSYANSSYHKNDKVSKSDEVLIVNYDIEQK